MRNMQDSRQPSQRDMQGLLHLYNAGQMPAAETAAKQLLKSYPGALVLHSVLGSALAAQRKFAEAAASFERVVALNPKSAETHSNLGLVLQEQG
ncbi:MAG TPA: tetratricopeptide repeat protein, partial [Methylophilaceae bacterium]|nr:tetratricopeptide repeat protein [Methylophilaceae bacterium]